MDDPTNPRDRSPGSRDPGAESSALIPRQAEERHAPPLDVDQREGHQEPADTIPLPDHGEEAAPEGVEGDIEDQIDETLPSPSGAPAHEAEDVPEDDIDDQIDETLPAPSHEEPGEPTTSRALDAETAFRLEEEEHEARGNAHLSEAAGTGESTDAFTALSMDAPDVNAEANADESLPVNEESVIYRSDTGATVTDARDETSENAAPPLADSGTTTCPTCGRQTDALRFCGYCGAALTQQRRPSTATTPLGRVQERAGTLLEPLSEWTRPAFVRTTLAVGATLILLALLANSGGLALMIGAAILPIILVYSFVQRDVFESEPPLLIAGLGVGGVLTGAVLGWFGAWLVANNWFDDGVLNYGAAGFGGRFAEAAGSAPFSVWSLNGIILPLMTIAAVVGVPTAMRQSMSLRNEVMDGLTLAGAVAAGFTLGTAMVFAAPMLTNGGPASDASGWTLTTIGVTIIRPLIWTLSGAMLGAGVWRYMLKSTLPSMLLPAIGGVGAPLLHTFVSIQLASTGLWPEVLWGIVVVVVVALLYRRVLATAIAQDRRVLGNDNSRVICPNCRRVTPGGAFCAHCGEPLSAAA
jgi:hypothetical protein